MPPSASVYLAGQITGLSYAAATEWREHAQRMLASNGIVCFSPMRHKEYLAHEQELGLSYTQKLSTARGITSRDRFDTMRVDLVIMNVLGMQRVSVGCMIELGWADSCRTPVILVAEAGNPHLHPMVEDTVFAIVETVDEAISLASYILMPGKLPDTKAPLKLGKWSDG